MKQTKHTPGPLRAYERNDDMGDWVIRDANNHLVAGGIPRELAILWAQGREMYELLNQLDVLLSDSEVRHAISQVGEQAQVHKLLRMTNRIKAAINGEG